MEKKTSRLFKNPDIFHSVILRFRFMKILFFLFFVFSISTSSAQLRLSAIFSDHMVLQRDKPIKIWGSAKPGETVRVSIGDAKSSVVADHKGYWLVTLHSF